MKYFTSYQKIKVKAQTTIEIESITSNFNIILAGFKEDGSSAIITNSIQSATQYNIEEYTAISLTISGSNQGDVTTTIKNVRIY